MSTEQSRPSVTLLSLIGVVLLVSVVFGGVAIADHSTNNYQGDGTLNGTVTTDSGTADDIGVYIYNNSSGELITSFSVDETSASGGSWEQAGLPGGHTYDVYYTEPIHQEVAILNVSVPENGSATVGSTQMNATGQAEIHGIFSSELGYSGEVVVRNASGQIVDNDTVASGSEYSLVVQGGDGPFNVTADTAEHNAESRSVSVSSNNRAQQNFSLAATEPGYVEGTVTLENDQGQNITVELVNKTQNVTVNSAQIFSGDTYNLSADRGEYEIFFNADGHLQASENITIQNSSTTTVSKTLIQTPPHISGAIDTELNNYNGDITVTIENSTGSVMNQTTVSGSGLFNLTINGQDSGTFTVTADSPDHDPVQKTVQINNSSDSKNSGVYEMIQSDRGNYSFTVTTQDGNGQDIEVTVEEVSDTKTIPEGGTAEFDLPTGQFNISIVEDGYQTEQLEINNTNSNQNLPVELQIANGTIQGDVLSKNANASQVFNVTIEETGATQQVTNGNTFTFDVAPGNYTVNASADGFVSDSIFVEVGSNETQSVSLQPYLPSNVSVTLVVENDSKAQSGTVTLTETGETLTIQNNTTKKFTGLKEGNYTLEAEANGHINQTTTVSTTAGETTQVDFTLTEDTGQTGVVGFSVQSEDGNATDITVEINETGQTFLVQENETTQVELSEGNYTFTANADGYNETSETIEVQANQTHSLTLTMGVAPPDVNASGVRIVEGRSYWVGQDFWREGLDNYTQVRWTNEVTNLSTNRSIDADNVYRDSVKNITDIRGANADYTVYGVDSTGNTTQIASVYLGVQQLNTSFNSNESVERAEINFNSNRGDGYEVIITQDTSDTNQLTTQELADLFGQNLTTEVRSVNGNQQIVAQIPSGSTSATMNVSNLERAEYNFNFAVNDTPASSTANVTLVVAPFEEDPDAEIADGGRYWLGQRLEASANINDGETISLYTDGGTFVQEVTADEFGIVQIRTNSIGTGTFYFQDSDGNRIMNFSIARQTVSADFTDDSILNAGSQSESGLTVESNRAGYDLLVAANYTNASGTTEEVNAGELAGAFGVNNTTTVNGNEYVVFEDISNLQTFIFDARNLSQGNYTFTVMAADADASGTANINISTPVEGQALFTQQFYTHNRGDVAEVTIDFSGDARNTTVKIGRYDRVGYELTAEITRNSNVSETTLLFNTSEAGQGNKDEVLQTKNGQVELEVVSETTLPSDRKLASARYLMELKVENKTTDLSTLNLFDAGVMDGEIYGVPPTVSSVGNSTVVMNESVEMEEIDSQSYVVVGFNVTGLEIQMNESRRTASDFERTSAFAQQAGISVTLSKDDAGMNEPPHNVSVSNALQYHYVPLNTSDDNNTAMAFFVFSPSEFNTNGDGEYHATMRIDGEKNAFVESDMNRTTNFTFVESETTFDRHWSGDILVLPESNQTISGTTTLPPGTNYTHEIRSENVRYPFYRSQEITVTENGTFEATYDLSNIPVGLEFNTSIPALMDNKTVRATDEIQPYPPENMSNVTIFTQVNGEPQAVNLTFGNQEVTPTDSPPRDRLYVSKDTYEVTGTVEGNQTNYTIDTTVTIDDNDEYFVANLNESGGGIEWGDPRDEPETYELTIRLVNASATGNNESIDGLVTLDGGQTKVATDSTVTYEVTAGEYVVSGQAHQYDSAQREVTVDNDTIITLELQPDKPEPVETPSGPTNNTTSRTPGQPGFGVVIALVALLGATLLARKRD